MNNNTEEKMYCTKCGEVMKASSRCCLKCGNLNPFHEANRAYFAKIQEIQSGANPNSVSVNSSNTFNSSSNNTGSYVNSSVPVSNVYTPVETNSTVNVPVETSSNVIDSSNSFIGCNIVNGIFLLLQGIFLFLIVSSSGVSSSLGLTLILLSIINLIFYGIEIFLLEMGEQWWSFLIPIYGNMVLSDIAFGNMIMGLLVLVPVIGEIVLFVIMYYIGEKIGKNGFLTALFFPFVISIYSYNATNYICGNPKKDSFNRFCHKALYSVFVLSLLTGIGLLLFF